MHLLGLDLSDRRAVGVVVDGKGTIVCRACRDGSRATDLGIQPAAGRRVSPGMAERVRFAFSELGDEGAAIGAARLAGLARR